MTNTSKGKVLVAGMMMLSLFAATSLIPASAQGSEENAGEKVRDKGKERVSDHARNITIVLGIGAAIETDENMMYRSHFKLGIEKGTATDTDADYQLKRGVIVINDEGSPVRYYAEPETWTIEVRGDNSAFTAKGTVKDSEENEFTVSLEGEMLSDTENGGLYLVKANFGGNDSEYDLYYLAVVRKPVVNDILTAARE